MVNVSDFAGEILCHSNEFAVSVVAKKDIRERRVSGKKNSEMVCTDDERMLLLIIY